MSDYAVEATSAVVRKVKIEVTSDDGARTLASGYVGTTQNYDIEPGPPTLSLLVYYEAGVGTWEKIKAAVDHAFLLYKETFR